MVKYEHYLDERCTGKGCGWQYDHSSCSDSDCACYKKGCHSCCSDSECSCEGEYEGADRTLSAAYAFRSQSQKSMDEKELELLTNHCIKALHDSLRTSPNLVDPDQATPEVFDKYDLEMRWYRLLKDGAPVQLMLKHNAIIPEPLQSILLEYPLL